MRRLAALLPLALAACPPTLDPHGSKCVSDSDCAPGQGLVCTAGLCTDPGAMGGGAGGGGGDGGVDAGGGGGGGGGSMDAGRTQVVLSIDAGAGDGGACTGGDGTETRWSDGSRLSCSDVALCAGADGGVLSLGYAPELVLIAQLVGEPRPDLVVLESRKLHVLENLGGFAFVERAPASAFGLTADPSRLFGACLNLGGATRAMMVVTRQTGQPGPLLYCPAGATCSPVNTWGTNCVDAVAAPFIGDGYDDLVVATPAKLGILRGDLVDAMANYGLQESGLSPVFHTPDGTPYYGMFEDTGSWRVMVLPTNDNFDSFGQSFINDISLTAIEAYGLSALLARFDDSMNGPQLELIDVHDGGTFLKGSTANTTSSTTRLIASHFSAVPSAQRACAIAATPVEVDRWQLIATGDTLAFTTMTPLYPGRALDFVSGDLDGDGLEDLVIAPASGNQLVILKGR